MQKKTTQPKKKNYGLRRLIGILLILLSSAVLYACLNEVTHGILVYFKNSLTKYLGSYAFIAPVIFLLLGIKVFFDARIGADKSAVKEASTRIEEEPVKVTKTKILNMPEVKQQPEPKVVAKPRTAAEPKETIRSVYDQEEFQEFTEGIRKQTTFRRILNYNTPKAYDNKQAKEEISKDPVQVPEWQEEKPSVVIRPIINYDGASKAKGNNDLAINDREVPETFEEEDNLELSLESNLKNSLLTSAFAISITWLILLRRFG